MKLFDRLQTNFGVLIKCIAYNIADEQYELFSELNKGN